MNKTFDLKSLPGFPATAKLDIDGATSGDIAEAIIKNTAFPNRDILLGDVKVDLSGKNDVPVNTGMGEVSFAASAKARMAIGIFDEASEVVEALALTNVNEIGLGWNDDPTQRYLVFVAGYSVKASANGKHPLGALGSATFGIDANQHSAFAIVSRFDTGANAVDTLKDLLKNWRFPSNVTEASDLTPGAAVLMEIDGELGLKLGAQIGYDFSFVREVQAGGLSGDLGLKVATKLSAELGFSASGRFILCVERPDSGSILRLRLFKLAKKGWSFALSLKVGANVTTPQLPGTADEFVQTVFGVHGQQVIADLRKLEKWTDPKQDTGTLVAGLAKGELLSLVEETTGIDPKTKFNEARDKFLNGLRSWQELPDDVSAWIWQELADATNPADQKKRIADLKAMLKTLATGDEDKIKEYVTAGIEEAGYSGTYLGKLLSSIAPKGVLDVLDDVPQIKRTALTLQEVLDGNFITKLQDKIITALDLQPVLDAVTQTDWNKLDAWLLGRLSEFFGEQLGFNRLDEVRSSIHAVLQRRQQVYKSVTDALKKQYEGSFAYSYQKNTTRTALLDVRFDLDPSKDAARAAFSAVTQKGEWEKLFLTPIPGVTVGKAVLTHGISRQSSLQFTLPMVKSERKTITDSLARLEITSEGEELVGTYQLNASDERRAAGRYSSRLALAASFPMGTAAGQLRGRGTASSKWTYAYRQVCPAAKYSTVRSLLVPLQRAYFTEAFPGGSGSFDTWLFDLDRQVEDVLHNGSNDFGDLLLSLEVTMPGVLVGAWFQPRDKAGILRASCAASKAIQTKLRELLFQSYIQDASKLRNRGESLDALLVYASLFPANAVTMDDGSLEFSTKEYYWDWPDARLVSRLARIAPSTERLIENMESIRMLLEGENEHSGAAFFTTSQAGRIVNDICKDTNYSDYLRGLLFAEAEMIRSTAKSIKELAEFSMKYDSKPADALRALAIFGDEITRTFNGIRSIYLPATIRTIGSVIFSEVTLAINETISAPSTPNVSRVLLALTVLKKEPAFKMADFLSGKFPESEDVATEQRLLHTLR